MGKSSPKPPDPVATANAQQDMNRQAAIDQQQLNMVDQFTPYGSLEYSKSEPAFDQAGFDTATADYQTQLGNYNTQMANYSPQPDYSDNAFGMGPGGITNAIGSQLKPNAPTAPDRNSFYEMDPELRYKATQTLSPENQQMLDLTNQAGIKFGETANRQLTSLSDRLSEPLPEFNQQYRQEAFQGILDRQAPIWEQDRSRMETSLANQGIQQGSEAWNRGTDDFNRSQTDFRLAADRQALGEAGNLYGLQAQSRNQPLNELNAMLSGSQVQSPNFFNTPQGGINPPNLQDLISNNYNQRVSQSNAAAGGLSSIIGSGLMAAGMFSDRRLKTNIRKIGILPNGLNVYSYNYIWGELGIGVMADEVRPIMPHAVFNVGGYDAVNYAEVLK